MPTTLFLRLDDNAFSVHPNVATNTAPTTHEIKLGSLYHLEIKPSLGGTQDSLPGGNDATGKLVLKRRDRFTNTTATSPLALRYINNSWTPDGTGATTKFSFQGRITSPLLKADLATAASVEYDCDIIWQYNGDPQIYQSTGHIVKVLAAVYDQAEAAPSVFVNRGRTVYVDQNYAAMAAAGINAVGTMQDAWDYVTALQTSEPGRAIIQLGSFIAAVAGSATIAGALIDEVTIIGSNVGNAVWEGLTFDAGATVNLEVLHCQGAVTCPAGTVNLTGSDAVITVNVDGYLDPGPGDAIGAGTVTASGPGLVLVNASLNGPTPDPASDGMLGRTGGAAGTLTLSHGARATSPSIRPGGGGMGGGGVLDGTDGGPAGAPGVLNVGTGCQVTDPDMRGGQGGNGGFASGADGDGGDASDGGTINQAVGSVVTGAILSNAAGGLGGVGASDGADSVAGTINGEALDLPALASVPPAAPASGGRLYFDGTAFKVRLPNGDIKTVIVS